MVYDYLSEYQRENAISDVAIIRLEQLAPFPFGELAAELVEYPATSDVAWVQEDPQNYGAWAHVKARYKTVERAARTLFPDSDRFDDDLQYIGRAAEAAQAVGFCSLALKERAQLIEYAFE